MWPNLNIKKLHEFEFVLNTQIICKVSKTFHSTRVLKLDGERLQQDGVCKWDLTVTMEVECGSMAQHRNPKEK